MNGVSVEEEHRRILREACLAPAPRTSLIDFLRDAANAAAPDVELDLSRSRERATRNTADFKGTGVKTVNHFRTSVP